MSIFVNNGQTAWEIYTKSIENLLGGGSDYYVIQPLSIASRIEWDSAFLKYNLFLRQQLGNRIPSWGPLYRTTGLLVADEYRAFMDRINEFVIGQQSNADRQRLSDIDKERKDIRQRRNALRKEIKESWDDYRQTTPTSIQVSYNRWLQDEGYETELGLLESELDSINGQYWVVFNNTGGIVREIGRATAALEASTSKRRLPTSSSEENYPEDSWSEFYKTDIEVDIHRFKQDIVETTIDIDEEQTRSTNVSKWWGGGASFSYGWFGFGGGFGGNSSHEQITRDAEERTVSIAISFKNVSSFPITREPWYKEGLIREYADNLPRSFWEQNGRLNLIPQNVLLAHGLKIDIKTTEEISHYYYESHRTSGRGGFRIGPWSFGGGGGSTSVYEDTTVEKTNTGFKVEDRSGRAVVLAVTSFRPVDILPKIHALSGISDEMRLIADKKAEYRTAFRSFENELIVS